MNTLRASTAPLASPLQTSHSQPAPPPAPPPPPPPPPPPSPPENVTWEDLNPGVYAAYSTLLGVAQETLMYPLDVLKTRQQHDVSPRPRPALDILRELWRAEGPRGLFRGYLANSAGSWPGQAVYFGGYEFSKHALGRATGLPTEDSDDVQGTSVSRADGLRRAAVSLMAGCLAETLALLVHQPADVVSQRQMVATYEREVDRKDMRRDVRARDIVRDIVRQEGWRGACLAWFETRAGSRRAPLVCCVTSFSALIPRARDAIPNHSHPQASTAAILHPS